MNIQIPYFMLEEELMKEDNNINLVKGQEPYISAPLRFVFIALVKLTILCPCRHYLVHLLKPYDENTKWV